MILLPNRLYDMGGTLRVSFAYAKSNWMDNLGSGQGMSWSTELLLGWR